MGEQEYNHAWCQTCKTHSMPKVDARTETDIYVLSRRCYKCGTIEDITVKMVGDKPTFEFDVRTASRFLCS